MTIDQFFFYLVAYIGIGFLVGMLTDDLIGGMTPDVKGIMTVTILWPLFIGSVVIILTYTMRKKHRKGGKSNMRDESNYKCNRQAINYCDKPSDMCCFQCDDRNHCNMLRCDQYDLLEYGVDCKYAEEFSRVE